MRYSLLAYVGKGGLEWKGVPLSFKKNKKAGIVAPLY